MRGYPRPTLGVSAVIALATTLLQLVLLLTLLRPLFDVDSVALESGDPEELVGLLAGAVGVGSLTLLFGTVTGALMTGFLAAVAGKAVLGEPLSLGELWAGTKGKLGRLVGGALLFTVLVYGGLVLAGLLAGGLTAALGGPGAALGVLVVLVAVVLAVVAYVRLSLAPAALVLEDLPVTRSLKRSWALVRRATWRTLGVLLLALLVGSVVAQLLQLPFALFSGDGGPLSAFSGDAAQSLTTRALVLSSVGTGVASTLVAPFTAGVTALLYVDRRMRAEGLDVALQAAAADRR